MVSQSVKYKAPFTQLWIYFWLVFIFSTAIVLGILCNIYDSFANTIFVPVPVTQNVTVVGFKEVPCRDSWNVVYAHNYLWTVQMTDEHTGNITYGHACASFYSNDLITANSMCGSSDVISEYDYPYKRIPRMGNMLRWFCKKCKNRHCTDFDSYMSDLSYFRLYMSKHKTHSSSFQIDNTTQPIPINAHDVILEQTPHFPIHDWRALWVILPAVLVLSIIVTGVVEMDNSDGEFLKINRGNSFAINSYYLRKTWLIKLLENIILSACTVVGTIYVFSHLTFVQYSYEYATIIQISFYFWLITISLDIATWIHAVHITLIRTGLIWQYGFLPGIGFLFRTLINEDNFIKFVTFQDTLISFHTLFHVPQLICVAYYYFVCDSTNDLDFIYFLLLCSNMFIVLVDFVYSVKLHDTITLIVPSMISNPIPTNQVRIFVERNTDQKQSSNVNVEMQSYPQLTNKDIA